MSFQRDLEAFAYVPPDMLAVATRVFAQGGQLADPNAHQYGVANSPKVRNMCIANCDNAVQAVWKTVLIINEGYGGTEIAALDITSPVTGLGVASPPSRSCGTRLT